MQEPTSFECFQELVEELGQVNHKAPHLLYNHLENDIKEKDQFLRDQGSRLNELIENYNYMLGHLNLLHHAKDLFLRSNSGRAGLDVPLLENMRFSYLGGLISSSEAQRFKKLIFRATRGKALCQFFEMRIDPEDNLQCVKQGERAVYLIMFEEGGFLLDRITKICQSFLGSVTEISRENLEAQAVQSIQKKNEIKEMIRHTRN